MILTLAELMIDRFMAALYQGKKDEIENWPELYTEFIDTSGMGKSRQFDLMVAIHNLETRLATIDAFVALQNNFVSYFGQPYQKAFPDVQRFGYRMTWNPEKPEDFILLMHRMTTKEKRNIAELNKLDKELKDLQNSKVVKEDKTPRQDFIRLLNTVERNQGYALNRQTTDMETVALMILQHNEESEAAMNKKQ